jgi:hypothetical protein
MRKTKAPKAPKPPKTRNLGTWTESKFWGLVRGHLRRMFRHNWEPAKQALGRVRQPANDPSRPRLKWLFTCQSCQHQFPRKEVELDHIAPCGSLLGPDDIPSFLTRLLPETPDAYQVLCKLCHQEKTDREREAKKLSTP